MISCPDIQIHDIPFRIYYYYFWFRVERGGSRA